MACQNQNYLKGKLLLAMPSMGDPRFDRAVIFICSHDKEGAMGLVINHALPDIDFSDLVKQLKVKSEIKINFEKMDLPVMYGGPVESARGFLLHSGDFIRAETMQINQLYGVTGTLDALKDIALGKGPENLMFILGYAGWEAGQLESEIMQNVWLITEPDEDLIFAANHQNKWTQAVGKLGIDPAMLSTESGSA
jgi:putative transcriptional regulator